MSDDIPVFQFKESDEEGLETLQVISDAHHFNDWMYDTIKPFCHGRILEVGSGIGNISERFFRDKQDIYLSDIRKNYRIFLSQKFPEAFSANRILDLDLVHASFDTEYSSILNSFDTVFALNVVEHIKDHDEAIQNCVKLLKPGGKLIILVPAYQSIYNHLDKELYHYRRYTKKTLEKLFTKNQVQLSNSFYFNAAGIPAWFISGRLQRHKTIPKGQMNFFNSLVPVFKIVDSLLLNSIGLSVVCVGRKPTKYE
ncbi:MAG TPA: methyltransferase [Bacteroidia bacterium]|nr:methyltransferase [Bacteroidia bacterium]